MAFFVAPGFGQRGIDGKIVVIQYARENNIPFFGVCLGMQMAVIEFARNVLNIADADSSEMNATTQDAVIDIMHNQKKYRKLGRHYAFGCIFLYSERKYISTKNIQAHTNIGAT
jgi:CTP synthase (UTP-ammonia lyase)